MFSFGIRYLNGWAMAASDGAKKEQAEWPPHPDRIFMALAAAWFETGQDEAEGAALSWLEALLEPPHLVASGSEPRKIVTSYVPVNDTKLAGKIKIEELRNKSSAKLNELKEAGLTLLAEFRQRQPRSFPVAIPHNPVVHIIWQEELPEKHRSALTALSRKVTSVGHSASLVQMWLEEDPPEANWIPVNGFAKIRMRVACSGRLQYLENCHNRQAVITHGELVEDEKTLEEQQKHLKAGRKKMLESGADKKTVDSAYKAKIAAIDAEQKRIESELEIFGGKQPKSLRPDPGPSQGYGNPQKPPTPDTFHSLFDPNFFVLKLSGKRLSLPGTLKLTQALRGALLNGRAKPLPEWLCGHTANGEPSLQAHIAMFPLPFVGAEHADGRLLGLGLVLPRAIDEEEAAQILEPWLRDPEENWQPRKIKLFDGQWLECSVELDTRESPPWNMQTETWTNPAKCWGSVTPVVLDRHFEGADKWEKAAETIKDSCERIGLPRPLEVLLHPVSMFKGVPRSNEFPWMKRKKDGGRMHHAHAVIVFDQKVQGPVLVGAGRFRGYGFCRPLPQEEGKDNV